MENHVQNCGTRSTARNLAAEQATARFLMGTRGMASVLLGAVERLPRERRIALPKDHCLLAIGMTSCCRYRHGLYRGDAQAFVDRLPSFRGNVQFEPSCAIVTSNRSGWVRARAAAHQREGISVFSEENGFAETAD